MKKVCTKCGIEKDFNEFHAHKNGRYGLRSKCKACCEAYRKEYEKRPEVRAYLNKKQREYTARKVKVNPNYWKGLYKKFGDKWNEQRNWKFHNDPDFRKKKDLMDKKYKQSEKGRAMLHKPENMLNAINRAKNYRKRKPEKISAYMKQYRENNKDFVHSLEVKRRTEMPDSYIAYQISRTAKVKVKKYELPEEVIHERRLIIKLKREIKNQSNHA